MADEVKTERIPNPPERPQVEVNWKRLLPFMGFVALVGGLLFYPWRRKEDEDVRDNGRDEGSTGGV
jgi:hypothetical protein